MQPKSVLDFPPVEVVWTDASIDIMAEASLDDLSNFGGLATMHTIGRLIRKTRKEVVLATDVCPTDNDIRQSYTIPRGWIRSIIYLQYPPGTQLHHPDEGPPDPPEPHLPAP